MLDSLVLDIENNVYFLSVVGLNISKKSIKKIQTNCKSIIPYGSVNSAVPLVKPGRRLTKLEQEQFVLTQDLQSILVGLYLGDLYVRKSAGCVNPRLEFGQGTIHEDYLLHLYELFKDFCSSSPQIRNLPPHSKTRKVYSSIYFRTYSLPCFNELYNTFYFEGKKLIPSYIGDLLTPLSLAYWISDDGSFDKRDRALVLSTQSFTLAEVEVLVEVLTQKFGLKCTINKNNGGFIIRISSKSLPVLQSSLKDIMPSMMLHKIGL
jgi:hypothetical protein